MNWIKISIKLSFNDDIAFFLDDDFLLFILIILLFVILLKLKEQLFSFSKLLPSIGSSLGLLFFLLLFLFFYDFLLMEFSSSSFSSEHSFQVIVSLFLIEHDSCVSLTTVVIMMLFVLVEIGVVLLVFTHFVKLLFT